ncbi:putative amino-acid acetyltransferase NAGS2, chloroplastic, partial [Glycine soja]
LYLPLSSHCLRWFFHYTVCIPAGIHVSGNKHLLCAQSCRSGYRIHENLRCAIMVKAVHEHLMLHEQTESGLKFSISSQITRRRVKYSATESEPCFIVDASCWRSGIRRRSSCEYRDFKSRKISSALSIQSILCSMEGGVQRVHLLDGTISGVLLLELFKRDGMGTMVASDLYEGTRMAQVTDFSGMKKLIQPFEESGILLLQSLGSFIVVEREGQIIACAALFPFFEEKCGEVAAIAVSPDCRGQGQGDKLLGYENIFDSKQDRSKL